ncbi:MAG TPA: hypothetical protein VME17_19095 [Bryobacteraceae bacterium]|nr:hypothetical protein [Bryobacteraceae bacterium]
MKPEKLHQAAEALQKSHHQHLGITAHPPQPPHAPPAARLDGPDILSFTKALDRAREQWPDSDLCLIGAQGALGETNIDDPTDTMPPGFLQFLDPEVLMRVPVGDPEDEGDQID